FIVIRSERLLTYLNDFLSKSLYTNITIEYILYLTWFAGTIISLMYFFVILRQDIIKFNKIISKCSTISKQYIEIANRAGIDCNHILISDCVDEAVTIGIMDCRVVLPEMDYTETDMENILFHEASHITHKDILIKVILYILVCVFWWNPIFRLLIVDYSILIEYRCDEEVVKGLPLSERIAYVETMKKVALVNNERKERYRSAGFAFESKKSALVMRAKRILAKDSIYKDNIAIIILALVLFVLSYLIIVQPYYDPNDSIIQDEMIINRNNAYIIENYEGYRLYIDGEDWGIISQKEMRKAPYSRLEIKRR
ncbi:MAG: M56 family metallopeptidase, partial [Lachnospiraceae bacterium]|nr:M56 family metallopeptidase [Lachnospiraceae bacterium]